MEETTQAVEVESTTSTSPDAPQTISVAGAQPEIAPDREAIS
jgi:hypothetical protein